ncbi:hypothetical protein [Prevotella falsenii]|uniref:hypothetical protein n=1 Tax=Prevotella falsenii TaxID=515414 RepID=UPI0012EC1AD2|nr:hypothetical protein [Prevotella falsenii]
MLLPSCFLAAFVRLPASAPPFHLTVARYAFDEMAAHLLDNRTKPVKDANERLGFILYGVRKICEALPLPYINKV